MIFGFQTLGLMFDIFGAFFLAKAIVVKPLSDIHRESSSYYNGNPYWLPAMYRQKLESGFGFTMMIVGFIFQAIGLKIPTYFLDWFRLSETIILLIMIGYLANIIIGTRTDSFVLHCRQLQEKRQIIKDKS